MCVGFYWITNRIGYKVSVSAMLKKIQKAKYYAKKEYDQQCAHNLIFIGIHSFNFKDRKKANAEEGRPD